LTTPLPDFPLASWEIPPGSDIALVAPADKIIDGLWHGRKTQICVRKIETSLGQRSYFCDAASREVGNWVIEDPDLNFESGAQSHLLDAMKFPGIMRNFYLDGARYGYPGPHELSISASKGSWKQQRQSPEPMQLIQGTFPDPHAKRTTFDVPIWSRLEFTGQRAAQIGRLARGWLDDPTSSIRKALDWLHLSESARQSHTLQLSQRDLKQFKTLMRCVLQTQSSLWAKAVAVE
jgi:hypothetical protein